MNNRDDDALYQESQDKYLKNKLDKNVLIFIGILLGTLIFLAFFYLLKPVKQTPAALTPFTGELVVTPYKNLPNAPKKFYGVNVDMSQLLPTSDHYVKNSKGEDLIDIASKLGLTMFRVTNVTRAQKSDDVNMIYSENQWNTVLNKMAAHNIRAVIMIETNSKNPALNTDNLSQDYLDFVHEYVIQSNLGMHPAVYAMDLKNEPVLSTKNIGYLKMAAEMIKTKYPAMHITIGGWRTETHTWDEKGREIWDWNLPKDAYLVADIVDVYSAHVYNMDKKKNGVYPDPYIYTTEYLKELSEAVEGKPILIQEFGGANGDAVSDGETVGSEQLQANIYHGVLKAVSEEHENNVIGAVSYVFMSRNKKPEAWSLLRDNGNYMYTAAYVLQQYATGRENSSLKLPISPVPENYLITDSNQNHSFNLKRYDILAYHFTPEEKSSYTLTVTPSDIGYFSEGLFYDEKNNRYSAVFHFTNEGEGVLKLEKKTCADTQCNLQEYNTSVTVVN